MNINWNRFAIENLPISLRKVGIYALLKVLLSPIVHLYNRYLLYSDAARKQSSYTPQLCMLEKIIFDELSLLSNITESTDKPFDFAVDVSVPHLDVERKLIALINSNKLASKNFLLSNAAVTWQHEYSSYQCERINVYYTYQGFVCERIPKIAVTINASYDGTGYNLTLLSPVELQDTILFTYVVRDTGESKFLTVYPAQWQFNSRGWTCSFNEPSRFDKMSLALVSNETAHYQLTLIIR